MDEQGFRAKAGGVFTSHLPWGKWTSKQKKRYFWAFHAARRDEGRSIYAGLDIELLMGSGHYSIEHVVPRQLLEYALKGAPRKVRYGASVNPFNFAACHTRMNQARGHADFDMEGDPLEEIVRLRIGNGLGEPVGKDAEGEWIPPRRSRGDIARACLYMSLLYGIRLYSVEDLRRLAEWARHDQPSQQEKQFSAWFRQSFGFGNPFVEDPELMADEDLLRRIRPRKRRRGGFP